MSKLATERVRSDRVNSETRALAALIVPFLVAAFAILYLRPDDTGRLFAWPIAPRMTSFLLGGAYIGGAYFFVRVVIERRWHRVAVGFLPVTTFASLMMVATLLHWDRFNHGSVAFTTWVVLYATTPFLVLTVWLRNRRRDPGVLDCDDVEVPRWVRRAVMVSGALVLLTGLFLFVAPSLLVRLWPWHLTPLTARVTGAAFALTGVFGVTVMRDRRWTSARVAFESQALAIVLILVGVLRAWRDFDTRSPTTLIFIAGMIALLLAIAALYAVLEVRRAARRGTSRPLV